MYKIVVNKKMPTTCEECGLYTLGEDDFSPFTTCICDITDRLIGTNLDCKETLPEWCPIENVVPKKRKKQSEEEKEQIAKNERTVYQKIFNSWFGSSACDDCLNNP